ncbi:MAG: hypothetical protein DIZ80_16050 [endosymbiont of Galathealinum brachiosum]|uniref:TonB-dependent receptor-like beta-barrel domain-containing protein n=1 Tax=endosymbiont of Galathealinum brachiosum TaxID=2200906 RepID=A0A370D9Y7_9GAMM|nr:MAG: hypothetical protein DIZ80_16050 [endosymbiont of Galathealinum brachiosum]
MDLSGPDLNAVSIKDIEQIEIIQSSAGVLYGDQAVGGVINVITRKPKEFTADIEARTGSYGRKQVLARITDKISNGVSYVLSGDVLEADNYRDNNELENVNLLGRIDYEFSSGNVYAEYQVITREQELPGALFSNEVEADRRQSTINFSDDYLDEDTKVSRVGTKTSVSDNWFVEAELISHEFEYESVQSSSFGKNTTPFFINSEQLEFTPRMIGIFSFNGGEAIITTGIDYLKADYESYLTDEQKALSYYMQAVVPLASKTSLTLGGRKARVENEMVSSFTNGELTERVSAYELGIQSALSDNLVLFARFDQNFRFAKVDELSFASPTAPLKTQTGDSNEVGIEWTVASYAVKAQVYRLELEDEIAYDPGAEGPFGPGTGANVNLDPTTHDGLIVEADYKVYSDLNVNAAFTYTDAIFDSGVFAGNKISGVPERKASMAADYRIRENLKTYVEVIYTDDHFVSGDNANSNPKLDGYTVVNANLRYQLKEWTFSARINNVFDKEYSASANESFGAVSFFPSPERNFWLSAAVRFE